MAEYYALTGRRYDLIELYRMEDAEYAIVCMGSMAETAAITCDYLRDQTNTKVGVVHVTAFRPFPGPELVDALKGTRAFAVLERMDNPMGQSNPLTAEIKAAFADALSDAPGYSRVHRMPLIYSGSAGLGSRDVRPGDFIAVVKNMVAGGPRYFVLGIQHELALDNSFDPDVRPKTAFSMRGHSVGGYGSVTTNKVIATIVGDLFDLYVQAYPKYGSEKKGLPTTYYLTTAAEPIRTHCELNFVEFVPLNDVNAFNLGNPLKGLQEGGTVFVQARHADAQDVWANIPEYARRIIRRKGIRVLYLDAAAIARAVASEPDLQVRMQGIVLLGVFLKATPFLQARQIGEDDLMAGVEKSLRKYFGKRSEQVVQDNLTAVRRGYNEVLEIPRAIIDHVESLPVETHGKLVGDVMHHGVIACHGDTALDKLVKAMADQHVSAIVVVDKSGYLEGLVSATDLVKAEASSREFTTLPDILPEHIMTRDVVTTTAAEPLADAVAKLIENRIHRLVVVQPENGHKRPVGILSVTDLAQLTVRN
jgi:pyruvate-ferredoxin/flavodoxin oxidoreductase